MVSSFRFSESKIFEAKSHRRCILGISSLFGIESVILLFLALVKFRFAMDYNLFNLVKVDILLFISLNLSGIGSFIGIASCNEGGDQRSNLDVIPMLFSGIYVWIFICVDFLILLAICVPLVKQ